MLNKLLIFAALFLFLSQTALASPTANEHLAVRAMRTLHGAEMTYHATYGNGNFGTLAQLGEGQLIDNTLATGYKHGYKFVVTTSPYTPPTTPAAFAITATPRKYRLYGRLSIYIGTDGVMRGADKGGQPANENDPIILEPDYCSNGSIPDNERCVISSLRTLHGAEMTWNATYGNGDFGSITELGAVALITNRLATGLVHGYSIAVVTYRRTSLEPARFRIIAIPQTNGITGRRSFYIGTEGVITGADRNGKPADESDPPIDS